MYAKINKGNLLQSSQWCPPAPSDTGLFNSASISGLEDPSVWTWQSVEKRKKRRWGDD